MYGQTTFGAAKWNFESALPFPAHRLHRCAFHAGQCFRKSQMAEGVMLSVLGALAGLLFAYGGLRLLVAAGAESIPRSAEVRLNPLVLLVTFSVSIATGIFFGVAPVMALSFGNVYSSLKSASGRTTSSIHSQYIGSSSDAVTSMLWAFVSSTDGRSM